MMLQGLVQHANKAKYLANLHSPTILTTVGVTGTVVTAYLTGRASFKAARLIATELEELEMEADEKKEDWVPVFTRIDTVKLVWKEFLPPVATGIITVASIIAANKISSTRIAALTVAAGVSERALNEYKDKVVEKLGVKQDQKIRDDIAQDRVSSTPLKEIVVVGDGQVLCFDTLTGRYFKSTMEDIKRAENKVNYEIINFMSCSLSHFYDEIGLPPTDYTDSVGWNSNVEIQVTSTLSEDNRPCLAISFARNPIPDYDKHWGD